MRRPGRYRLCTAIALFLTGLGGAPARAADPDFTNVADFLGGQRHVLRADDLVFLDPRPDLLATGVLKTQQLQTQQSGFALCGKSGDAFLVRLGRVFALKNDVVVRIAPSPPNVGQSCTGLGLFIEDPQNGANNSVTALDGLSSDNVQIALGDFNRDGFADIVVLHNGTMSIYTARSSQNPAQGLRLAATANLPSTSSVPSEPVVGDFNGDGALDIAWVSSDGQWAVNFATVCTASQPPLLGTPCEEFQIVPVSHTIPLGGIRRALLTSGDYDGLPNSLGRLKQELVVVREFFEGSGDSRTLSHDLSVSSFDQNLVPTQIPGGFTFPSGAFSVKVDPPQPVLTSGRLQATSKTDQVVFAHGWPSDIIRVITFDRDLRMTEHQTKFDQFTVPYFAGNDNPHICFDHVGLAAGRYDPPDTSGGPDLNLQIALFIRHINKDDGTCDHPRDGTAPSGGHVAIFTIDFQSFALTLASFSPFVVPSPPGIVTASKSPPVTSNLLWAGDTQGRSLLLGEPTKVVIESFQQPSVILAAPPMHVDFISPDGTSAPVLLNLTVVPGAYFTKYDADQASSEQSSDQHTTSWSGGLKIDIGAKAMLGKPKESNLSIAFNNSFQAAWEKTSQSINESYSERSLNISQQTVFNDQVWFTESRHNLYIYPVLGHLECLDDDPPGPDCPDDKKRPLFVTFSGPDQIQNDTISGSSLEWYQPPWEPGNVFSYPATKAQLEALYPNMAILSGDSVTWFTDASVLAEKTSWASGGGQSQSTSSKQTISNETSVTVAGQYVSPGGGSSFGGSLTIGGSFSNTTAALNTKQTKVQKSSGISIQKPGSFRDPSHYQYAVTPYIFGEKPKPGNVNVQPALPTDIKTFGILQTAFLANPTDSHAGAWWTQAYPTPDVALNHPARWSISTETRQKKLRTKCLTVNPTSQTVQCATLAVASPDNPWLSEFHYLRGFFITNDGASGGPQLQTATAGDKLLLQARVYNYSLTPMPERTTVHVRFYAQPWNQAINKPLENNGAPVDSFLIGEDTLGPILPFSDKGPLNWVLAQTKFDTTPYGNQYLAFWVIVWMENGGPLVAELPHHGLKTIPGTLRSLKDAHDLSEDYSNNVGFYKFAFFVRPAASDQALDAALAQPGPLRLGPVDVSSSTTAEGESIEVSTTLSTGDAVPGVTVLFYDGDPGNGGKLFDAERVAYVRANDTHQVSVRFNPDTCGERRVFAVVGRGTPREQVSSSDVITPRCPAR